MSFLSEISAIQGRISSLNGADDIADVGSTSPGASGVSSAIAALPNDLSGKSTFQNMISQALGRLGSLSGSAGVGSGAAMIAPSQLEPMIARSAAAYKVDPNLVKAVIANESGFNANAVSPVGAQGLMQLMPGTAAGLGVNNSFDPGQNIAGGTRYLRGLYDRFGDWKLAVAAYNAGPGAVSKYGGVPPYSETQNYVTNVMGSYSQYARAK